MWLNKNMNFSKVAITTQGMQEVYESASVLGNTQICIKNYSSVYFQEMISR